MPHVRCCAVVKVKNEQDTRARRKPKRPRRGTSSKLIAAPDEHSQAKEKKKTLKLRD
jgi:hypothetical protein